jgi:hypothetical protein
VHIHHFSLLRTITIFASHSGYVTSRLKPASNRRWTSARTTSTFSSDILRSFCFLGFAHGLICSLCSITSLSTPIKLEVDQAKMSLFLSRNCRSSAYSSGCISAQAHTVLSGTLGSNGTLVNSPSISFAFLNSGEAAFFTEGCSCSVSSLKKCTFLCSRAKLHSLFQASFCLLSIVIMPKVARILRYMLSAMQL